ncbi:hypothetical protein SDC9_133025 [bioreactor metagenome]|uniref:Uncharacterized protein n=1 Tax=bioreactor metagenome TaxID=1076179 RepID=A0A645DBI0_9ZZZZ
MPDFVLPSFVIQDQYERDGQQDCLDRLHVAFSGTVDQRHERHLAQISPHKRSDGDERNDFDVERESVAVKFSDCYDTHDEDGYRCVEADFDRIVVADDIQQLFDDHAPAQTGQGPRH